jgi:hypothetical protein
VTQDEIIEMAEKAGFDCYGKHITWDDVICTDELNAFAELAHTRGYMDGWSDSDEAKTSVSFEMSTDAVEAEREACAKVCEDGLNIATCLNALDDMEMWGEKFAKAIRARGQA